MGLLPHLGTTAIGKHLNLPLVDCSLMFTPLSFIRWCAD